MSSAINLSQYNLMGFNITPEITQYLSAAFAETIRCTIVTVSNNVYPQTTAYNEITKGRMSLIPGRFTSAKWSMVIDCINAEILGYFWQNATTSDTITAQLLPSIEATLSAQYDEDILMANRHLSQIAAPAVETSDEINQGNAHLAQIVHESPSTNDVIDAVSSVLALDILTCILTVTLRPGQTMIIDANTYNVWIDQANAVHVHSGDWLDELNRETQSFEITAASGGANIDASILYTERYL